MTQDVGVRFSGNSRGAVTAARETAGGIDQVTRSAHGSSPALRNLDNDLGRATRGAIAGSGAFHGLQRSIATVTAGYAGAFGLAAAIRGAGNELVDSIKINAQVQAVLRATGGVAGVTAAHIEALADAQLRKTGTDDELIKKAAAVLLTFRNVRDVAGEGNDVFDQTIKLSQDLAVVMGQDVTSAALQLGKALQDPITGMTALRRVGISFDEDQRKQIKNLVEHGKLLQAQRLILQEVAREVGGTAEKVGDAAPWMRLKETLRNLSAEGIKPLLPEVDHITERVQKWADGLANNSEAQQRLKDDVNEAVGVVKDFAAGADKVAGALGGWKNTAELLVGLKVAKWAADSLTSINGLIGTVGKSTGLKGADGAANGLLGRLKRLTLSPWIIPIALSFIPPDAKGQAALDKAGLGFLGHLPFIGGAETQVAAAGQATHDKLFGKDHTDEVTNPKALSKQQSLVTTAILLGPNSNGIYDNKDVSGVGETIPGVSAHPQVGYDCSGYLYDIYKRNGIPIPRTSEGQWADPNAVKVPKGSEEPGDGVYFEAAGNGYAPPGHCGIYIGNGRFIEYYQSGKPARVSNLSDRGDYWGARRWVKVVQQTTGGDADPPTTGSSGSTASKNALPVNIRQAISAAGISVARAALTPGKADDKAALAQQRAAIEEEIAWLNQKLATKLGPEKRITYEDLLTGALGDLKGLDPTKKAGGASISTVTSLRASLDATLRGVGVTRAFEQPLFSTEGPSLYGAAFEHNKAYAVDGPYQTKLTPVQEASFRKWVKDKKVPFDVNASIVDYDMRGYWLAKVKGKKSTWKPGPHFPDTFKTPYDTTFSAESKYATADNPFVWKGNNLVDKTTGELIFGKAGVVANLPSTLDDTERLAVTKLEQLRDHLKVGLSAKDLATTRASITHWGNVLKDEISVQAKAAADASAEAARLWQRSWTNDVDKVLRDFDENIAGPQLDRFDKETTAHLKVLQDKLRQQLKDFDAATKAGLAALAAPTETPEETAYRIFTEGRAADQRAKQKTDLDAQIKDVQDKLAGLGVTTSGGGVLIDIATGQRTLLQQTATDIVDQQKTLTQQLLDLQDQRHGLELDDQERAFQDAANLSRKAAEAKAQADQDAFQQQRDDARQALSDKEADAETSYGILRDGQKTALQDRINDQRTALNQDLEDWGLWLDAKKRSYADFIAWISGQGLSTQGIVPPNGETSVGIFKSPGAISRAQGGFNFARGGVGRVPGTYVGRDDTIMARYTPGEAVIDRQLTAAMEDFFLGGGGGSFRVVAGDVYLDSTKVGKHIARGVTDAQDRQISYTLQRG